MLVLLGEVGGTEEYKVCEAIKLGAIKKPIVSWCIGTCADMFSTDVQFGHAGRLFLFERGSPRRYFYLTIFWSFTISHSFK